jgi:hypothetical protein
MIVPNANRAGMSYRGSGLVLALRAMEGISPSSQRIYGLKHEVRTLAPKPPLT